jgi:hypothetical protein
MPDPRVVPGERSVMNALPREHGLIVIWVLTIVGAVLLSSQFRPYGVGLVVLLLPTLFLYDRLIVGLRLWSIGKMSVSGMLMQKVGVWPLVLLSVVLAYVLLGLLIGVMPWLPVLAAALALLLEGLAFRYLRERHVLTRAVSILTVTSQFLLINSALNGSLTSFEVAAFILLSLVNVLLVVDVVELVEASRIRRETTGAGLLRADALFFAGSVAISLAISVVSSLYYLTFLALLIGTQGAFLSFARHRSMKVVGIISSAIEMIALVILLVRFYSIL